jgi:tight adherence protein B
MTTTVILLVVCVTVFVMGMAFLATDVYNRQRGVRSLDRRIDRLASNLSADDAGFGEEKSDGFDLLPPEEQGNFISSLFPALPSYSRYVEQADIPYKPAQIVAASIVGAVAGFFAPTLLGMSYAALMGGTLGVILGSVPFLYVWWKRRGRLKKFEGQLGEALELVARALRAGHSLASGMHVVQEEMPLPISKEFGRVYEEQNLGIPIEIALRNLAERIPNLDLKFFVTAVIIQRTTGGDLAEILDKIGYLIRERFKIMGMVQALTGEGRLSGVILIAMPFALLLMMMQVSPGYVDDLWLHPLGRKMSIGAIVLMILGAWWINKIVNIKI